MNGYFMRRHAGVFMLVVALGSVGCASGGGATGNGMTNAEIEEAYRARIEADRKKFVAADVNFMTNMIHHHAQALHMSKLVPARSSNASVRTLAARIINAQQDEIAVMQQWLRQRGQPVPELHVSGDTVMVHGAGDHTMHMPGMLSTAQMDSLSRARGVEFDRLFLSLMIQHHRGAVGMVRELLATDGAVQDDAVFKLASDVQADQTTEVARMEQMLSALSERQQREQQ